MLTGRGILVESSLLRHQTVGLVAWLNQISSDIEWNIEYEKIISDGNGCGCGNHSGGQCGSSWCHALPEHRLNNGPGFEPPQRPPGWRTNRVGIFGAHVFDQFFIRILQPMQPLSPQGPSRC